MRRSPSIRQAGWRGGLTFGYEKFINDIEALQQLAELATPVAEDTASLGWDALQDVDPGGHFFATQHTMDRYRDAFYTPLVADLSNHGAWKDAGARTATDRATTIWQDVLRDFTPAASGTGVADRLARYVEEKSKAGGAAPSEG